MGFQFCYGPDRQTCICREYLRLAPSRCSKIPRSFDSQSPTFAICRRCRNSRTQPAKGPPLRKRLKLAAAGEGQKQLASTPGYNRLPLWRRGRADGTSLLWDRLDLRLRARTCKRGLCCAKYYYDCWLPGKARGSFSAAYPAATMSSETA